MPTPVLECLAPNGFAGRVLGLEPIARRAGSIVRSLALRDDAFETELAGVSENQRAVRFDVLVEPQSGTSLNDYRR